MARQQVNQANKTYQASQDLTKGSEAQSANLYGTLNPAYTNETVNPQGFGTKGITDMRTSAMQGAGGSQGAAAGKGAQYAAANRNLGSFNPAVSESAREATRGLGDEGLKIDTANEMLKQQQRQGGLAGLSDLYGTANRDVLASLGLQNQATDAAIAAQKVGWLQDTTDIMNALKGAGYSTSTGPGGASSMSITG